MFYLNEFFRCFQSNPLKILCLFISSILFGLSVTQKDFIQSKIKTRFTEEVITPHFFALFSKKININKMKKKLKSLPGIKGVDYINQKKIQKKVNKEIGSLKLNSILFKKKYTAIKILFENDLSLKGQNLIKKYLNRYIGEFNVVLGKTIGERKYKEKVDKEKGKISKIYWGGVFSPLLVYWILSFFIFSQSIWKKSYLIESFQRKKNVHLKVLISGVLFLLLVIMTLSHIGENSGLFWTMLLVGLFISLTFLANFKCKVKRWT